MSHRQTRIEQAAEGSPVLGRPYRGEMHGRELRQAPEFLPGARALAFKTRPFRCLAKRMVLRFPLCRARTRGSLYERVWRRADASLRKREGQALGAMEEGLIQAKSPKPVRFFRGLVPTFLRA